MSESEATITNKHIHSILSQRLRTTFPDEWIETARQNRTLSKLLYNKIPHYSIDLSYIDLLEQAKKTIHRSKEETSRLSKSITKSIDNDTQIRTSDGVPVVLVIKNGLNRAGLKRPSQTRETEYCPIDVLGLNAVTTLIQEYEPPLPKHRDTRHQNHQQCQRDAIELGNAYGVYHFAWWTAQGQQKTLAPTLSVDITKNSGIINSVTRFYKAFTPVTQALSIWMQAFAPKYFLENLRHFMHTSSVGPLSLLATTHRCIYHSMAIVVNLQVDSHRDTSDIAEGFTSMTVLGDFIGGDLVLPDCKVRIHYQAGDVVIFKSRLLEHFVDAFTGNRIAIVQFTHKTVRNLFLNNEETPEVMSNRTIANQQGRKRKRKLDNTD